MRAARSRGALTGPALASRRSARDPRAPTCRRPGTGARCGASARAAAHRARPARSPTGPAPTARHASRASASARAHASAAALAVPGRGVRPDDERGVAQETDAAEGHARHLDVVDHLEERPVDALDHPGDRRRQPGPGHRAHLRHVARADRAGRHRELPPLTGLVREHVVEVAALEIVAIPDEVHQPLAGRDRPVGARDRVREDVAVRVDVIGDGIGEGRARRRVELRLRAPCRATPRIPRRRAARRAGARSRAVEPTPSAHTRRSTRRHGRPARWTSTASPVSAQPVISWPR